MLECHAGVGLTNKSWVQEFYQSSSKQYDWEAAEGVAPTYLIFGILQADSDAPWTAVSAHFDH